MEEVQRPAARRPAEAAGRSHAPRAAWFWPKLTVHVRFLAAGLLCSLAVTAWMLVSSQFLPYVTDNNESFSTLVHARNVMRFGVGVTAGLTDEANSPDRAAHPYLYTHEGNFPRIPALGLLLAGINRVEWQITVLAIVVGSLTTYLCFAVLSRIGGDLFAFLAVLIFGTDYLLYVQWQVNTFRVWHAFFLFASLWLIQRITERNARAIGAALLLNTMCLFYFEIVFAMFVAVFSCVYAAILHGSRPGRIVRITGAIGAAAIASLGLLLAQLVGHFGLSVAWQDIRMTFLSRSVGDVSAGLEEHWRKLHFFLEQHIAYWDSTSEQSTFPSIQGFVYGLGHGVIKVYTPYLAVVSAVISVALLLPSRAVQRAATILRRAFEEGAVGHTLQSFGISRGWLTGAALCAGLGVWAVVGMRFAHPTAFGSWTGVIATPAGGFGLGLLIGLPMLWAILLWLGNCGNLCGRAHGTVRDVAGYFLAGSTAFVCMYVVLPGYVWNGYLSRYAPLPVFVTDVWLALILSVLVTLANGEKRPRGEPEGGAPSRLLRLTSATLLVLMTAYWVGLQATYALKLPPTSILFMRRLSGPQFKHASFVSDNYALPIAYFTEQWAYQDQTIPWNVPTAASNPRGLHISGKYLWFADRNTNPSYLQPRYYLCRINPTWETVSALVALPPGKRLDNCSGQPLVRNAARGGGVPFAHTLVAQDPAAGDMWSIVRLDPTIFLVPKD